MGSRKSKAKPQELQEMGGMDRLGLRVSAMINSPLAQLERRVLIHRLDTDEDAAWEGILEVLAETDGIEIDFNDDGSLTLKWERSSENDAVLEGKDVAAVCDEAPF